MRAKKNVIYSREIQIAALEQSTKQTEKLISDARDDRLKHLEEVYQANRRCAELESRSGGFKSDWYLLSQKPFSLQVEDLNMLSITVHIVQKKHVLKIF